MPPTEPSTYSSNCLRTRMLRVCDQCRRCKVLVKYPASYHNDSKVERTSCPRCLLDWNASPTLSVQRWSEAACWICWACGNVNDFYQLQVDFKGDRCRKCSYRRGTECVGEWM